MASNKRVADPKASLALHGAAHQLTNVAVLLDEIAAELENGPPTAKKAREMANSATLGRDALAKASSITSTGGSKVGGSVSAYVYHRLKEAQEDPGDLGGRPRPVLQQIQNFLDVRSPNEKNSKRSSTSRTSGIAKVSKKKQKPPIRLPAPANGKE